ncbi:HAAS signaling domain-containing protein [Bacillus xiapuensis]|uniref:HAAS signaling domain-containing protein n=1 Tax=Bacillus xiapuensis TaxID=2014075 RepID=UPI000C240DF2|nr:DUF1700 domain-containing protein [Bacillus xiapuensis]
MSKKQFLVELKRELRKISRNEKEEILQDYEEYFRMGLEEGKQESQIVESLGSPKEIAKELNAVYAMKMVDEEKSIRNMFAALFSMMGLSLMNSIVIAISLFFLLILTPFIAAYVIGVPIMILSPLILIVIGFVKGFSTIGIADILETMKGVIIGSLLAILGYYIAKFAAHLFIKYLRWNLSIARRKNI